MDFDATSFYPSAMWDEKSVYPKIEIGFAFKPHMKKIYVEAFNNQTFNRDGNESAILKKNHKPPNPKFQQLPIKEKMKNIEVNRMISRYIMDTLTSVNNQEIVKFGKKVTQNYEGVIYQENFL